MLTGNLLIGQSGGPTPVINATLAGVIDAALGRAEVRGIFGMLHGIEGLLNDDLIDLGRETPETLQNLVHTPASALGSCRHKVQDAEYERILAVCRSHGVRHFVYIGGNDSMDTCRRIAALAADAGYELQVIGAPKTIDNDLAVTDHCPGYGSAARFIALAVRDTGLDLEAMATFEDVVILEVMGRNAGWLAAAAGLAKSAPDDAPHLVYVPELPFSEATFLDAVAEVHGRLGRVYVVVCESVRDAARQLVGRPPEGGQQTKPPRDEFGHVLNTFTTGVASYLAERVTGELGLKARFLRPVLIGRTLSACVSEVDRREAYRAGRAAVGLLAAGESEKMVTLERAADAPYGCEMGAVALEQVANVEKLLPRAFMDEAGCLPTEAFAAYARPLLGAAWPPAARLEKHRLPRRLT